MEKDTVEITKSRFEELTMIENRNQLLEARLKEALAEITELQNLLNKKVK
jgi:hypothetical protein